jgi:hypothetical protein
VRPASVWTCAAAAGFAAFVSLATHAWACVPQPLIAIHPRASASPGAQVELEGLAFNRVPVEIRWNGTDGELLGESTGPSFKSTLAVPRVTDGLYTVIALERLPGGAAGGTARASLLVSADGPPGPNPQPGGDPAANARQDAQDAEASLEAEGSSPAPFWLLIPAASLFVLGAFTGSLLRRRRDSPPKRRKPPGHLIP